MRFLKSGKQCPFRLSTLLLLVTIIVCILAVGKALPLGARQVAICVSVVIVASSIVYGLLAGANQTLARKDSLPSLAIGSVVLISVCTTIIVIVLLVSLMQVPARTGPIQYATGSPQGMFVFRLRVTTMLFMLVSPIVSGVIGIVRASRGISSRPGWLIAGIASFVVAWIVVMSYSFFPTV